jgi:hypothetical protein
MNNRTVTIFLADDNNRGWIEKDGGIIGMTLAKFAYLVATDNWSETPKETIPAFASRLAVNLTIKEEKRRTEMVKGEAIVGRSVFLSAPTEFWQKLRFYLDELTRIRLEQFINLGENLLTNFEYGFLSTLLSVYEVDSTIIPSTFIVNSPDIQPETIDSLRGKLKALSEKHDTRRI